MNEVSKIPRRLMPFLAAALVAGIVVPAILLYEIRSRLDLSLWLWGLLAIVGVFVVAVPIVFWQERPKKHSRSVPWPLCPANPHFGKATRKDISLEGTLTWTAEIFKQMVGCVLRFTPAGRSHRRTVYILSLIGTAGAVLGAIFAYQREWAGLALIAASAILLTFTYSLRARAPEEIRNGARIRWTLLHDQFRIEPVSLSVAPRNRKSTLVIPRDIHLASARAIVRTPAGFIIWPDDLIEIWLPTQAFATAEQVEMFHEIARSCVANYVYEPDAR